MLPFDDRICQRTVGTIAGDQGNRRLLEGGRALPLLRGYRHSDGHSLAQRDTTLLSRMLLSIEHAFEVDLHVSIDGGPRRCMTQPITVDQVRRARLRCVIEPSPEHCLAALASCRRRAAPRGVGVYPPEGPRRRGDRQELRAPQFAIEPTLATGPRSYWIPPAGAAQPFG